MRFFISLFLFLTLCILLPKPAFAIIDPLSTPNNKFGIHIITATPDEIQPAIDLVNSNGGDWGYITFLIESKDRDQSKWQKIFNLLREKHLIPLVRLATQPDGGQWMRPYEGEEVAWADFLDNLNWPTKNRYIIVYNEPNHAQEWHGAVDPGDYAKTLDKMVTILKSRSKDYFILNAGFDASAPEKRPNYADELNFLKEMDQAVPEIFEKLDGWASHSYPNPEFSAPPDNNGRVSVRTYTWELQKLKELGVKKDLPVFITETGWKHAEGQSYNGYLLDPETVAEYYETAFKKAWSNPKIVAVTPFVLNYQESPFDNFSFKKNEQAGCCQNHESEYHPQYQKILDLPKVYGLPAQETKAQLTKGQIYPSIVGNEKYTISLTFKNIGQSIWNDRAQVKLVPIQGRSELGLGVLELPLTERVLPGEEYTFNINIKAPADGKYKVSLNLFIGESQFANPPFEFTTEVKSPVLLKIQSNLKWKEDSSGNYWLTIAGATGQYVSNVILGTDGSSEVFEVRYLPPDLVYSFILERPYYKSTAIRQRLTSGENTLSFGELQPDISSAILNPKELWKLLPWSN